MLYVGVTQICQTLTFPILSKMLVVKYFTHILKLGLIDVMNYELDTENHRLSCTDKPSSRQQNNSMFTSEIAVFSVVS